MKIVYKSALAWIPLLVIIVSYPCSAQSITTPRTASPAAEVSQVIGISNVSIKYSRPSVKGRKVWGELVQYGWNVQQFGAGNSAPWRAGANENTTITFSHNAKVQGVDVPAGTYGFFLVINEDNNGEIVLSKNSTSWGSFFYNATEDQMRAKITIRENPFTELLTYSFINLTKYSAELVLNWENKQFPVKIEFEVDDIVMANAKNELRMRLRNNAAGFISAAQYSWESNKDSQQGMEWADKALQLEPTNFAALRVKSRFMVKKGKAAEADKLVADALLIASESDMITYGYQLIGLGLFDKSIHVLKMCTQRFPDSANSWDSLGEAYAYKGDKPNAIKNFKKALTLNPSQATKQNSEKYLRDFGAL